MNDLSTITQNAGAKSLLGLFMGVLAYFWNCVNELLVILFMLLIMDYLTGIVSGLLKGPGFNWDKAWRGALKKLMYGPVVILGFVVDYVLKFLTSGVGITLGFTGIFSIAVCIYLIGTEGFSIIQNLLTVGVPAPDFILKAFGLMRDQAGKLVKVAEEAAPDGGGGPQ